MKLAIDMQSSSSTVIKLPPNLVKLLEKGHQLEKEYAEIMVIRTKPFKAYNYAKGKIAKLEKQMSNISLKILNWLADQDYDVKNLDILLTSKEVVKIGAASYKTIYRLA